MTDPSRTNQELIKENATLKRRIRELENRESDRKRADEALQESQAFYHSLVEQLPAGVFLKDLEGRYAFVSPWFCRLKGLKKEEFLGKTPQEVATREAAKQDATEQAIKYAAEGADHHVRIMQTGNPIELVEEYTDAAGRKQFVHVIKIPVFTPAGKIIGTQGILFDITDRKRTEEELQITNQTLQAIIDASPLAIFTLDHDLKVTYWSPAAERVFGWSSEETIGQYNPIVPTEKWDEFKFLVSKVFSGIAYSGSEVWRQTKDGRSIFADVSTAPLRDAHGKVVGAVGVIQDITARKRTEEALRESEEKYRTLSNNIPDIIYSLDKMGNILAVNESAVSHYNYEMNIIVGKPFLDIIYPDDQEKMVNSFLKAMEDHREYTRGLQFRILTKNGSVRWVELNSHMRFDEQGGYLQEEGVLRDITERKQTEDEKRILEERLQRAEKMEALGTLAGGVAHDLNNVLGIVIGYAELLLNEVDMSNPIRPRLLNIVSGGERAAAIVQDLLTLARRGIPSRQIINLNKVIGDDQHLSEFEKLISHRSPVQLKIDLEPNIPNISGSAVHIGKTLFNLVSNACEAMPNGGVLTIRTANQYIDKPIQGYDDVQEGDYVVLSVSDTGEGIPAADLKRIFEPFYTKKVMGRSGTGLGLAVVWGTVKDHYGYINVQSEKGKGSTFTLYFPVTREEITADQAAVPVSAYMGRGESVLVVDDVKGQRELAAAMLEKLNYSVTSVAGGEEAVLYLKEHGVDLLVLDMIMDPGMDGLDTYRSVLKIHPKQKAIIVSGFSETDRVSTAQSLGAGAYVRKPYLLERLGLAVRKELDRPR
jgi:PAS domain S-box-containing protein